MLQIYTILSAQLAFRFFFYFPLACSQEFLVRWGSLARSQFAAFSSWFLFPLIPSRFMKVLSI